MMMISNNSGITMKKLTILSIAALLSACANQQTINTDEKSTSLKIDSLECQFPDSPEQEAPRWVCDEKFRGLEVQAMGMSDNKLAGVSHQRQLAILEAQATLAAQLKNQIDASINRYTATKGTGANAKAASTSELTQTLNISQEVVGAEIYQSVISEKGAYYVLVGLEKDDMKHYVKEVIEQSVDNNEELWQRVVPNVGKEQLAKDIANFALTQ